MNDASIEILYASPKKNGNSALITYEIESSFAKENISLEIEYLYDLDISGCTECEGCYDGSDCVIQDDMAQLYKKIELCDGLIIITPVFFANLPSQAKALVDRMQMFYIRKYLLKISPRKPGLGTLIAHSERDRNFSSIELTVRYFFDALGMEFFPPLYFPRFSPNNKDWEKLIEIFACDFVKRLKEVKCE